MVTFGVDAHKRTHTGGLRGGKPVTHDVAGGDFDLVLR